MRPTTLAALMVTSQLLVAACAAGSQSGHPDLGGKVALDSTGTSGDRKPHNP